jgi:uncharacterized membrane protein YedE/YeeE
MDRPAKVLGFLDVTRRWDPTLAFVMGGALVVAFFGFRLAARRPCSISGEPERLPSARGVDGRLIAGAALFGLGWGLVGLCPGPAIVNVAYLNWRALVFGAAMLAGMKAHALFVARAGDRADG